MLENPEDQIAMNTIKAELEEKGYYIAENVIPQEYISEVLKEISSIKQNKSVKSKNSTIFGIRGILSQSPETRELAFNVKIFSLVKSLIGESAHLVKGIYFDKTAQTNWKVPHHQDLTIAVKNRVDIKGFGPWSIKAGVHHVQAPIHIMKNLLAVRCHLDEMGVENGTLRVIPGSHHLGKITNAQLNRIRESHGEITCCAPKGSIMLMRPLLLHASSKGTRPMNRRVIHFEYAPEGLLPKELVWQEKYSGPPV